MLYLGADPGLSGGLAVVGQDGGYVNATTMPATERELWTWITATAHLDSVTAVLEQVTGYVGDGGNPGSAMFRFGTNYGELRMALTAAGIPFHDCPPRAWQKALGIHPRGKSESNTAWKNQLKAHAGIRFPGTKPTLKTADAMLIALYCQQTYGMVKA